MGKINKEKLLKEFKKHGYEMSVIGIIKNFTEEPEQAIDFDALYEDLLKDCGDSCTKDESCKACVFDFLKSKNLTQPQIDMDQLRNDVYSEIIKTIEDNVNKPEIPVKKTGFLKRPSDILEGATWIEFKGFKKALVDDNLNIGKRSELEFPEFCYTDITEEPDYSKIPKGSVVEIEFISGNGNNCWYVNGVTSKSISLGFHMLYNSGNSTTINFDQIESIVILKLAKE